MEPDDEVMSGYLIFPPGGNAYKGYKKKSWQQKFCILYNASKQGIERLEIYDTKDDSVNGALPKIITLESCIKITPSSHNTITIFTKTFTQHLQTTTDLECSQWVTALQSVAFKDNDSSLETCNEDNDLYCSTVEGVFSVKLVPSDASTRCGLEPIRYSLLLTVSALELRDINDNSLNATWPYRYIRRYGYRKGKFTFEAGRKCETGEGIFHLEHPCQHEIFRCLNMKMKAMKQMMGNDSLPSPDHSDIQSQLTSIVMTPVNMTPGSRIPFVAMRPDELDLSSVSINMNSISSLNNSDSSLINPKSKPALKPKPLKPPRKSLPKIPDKDTNKNSETVEKYPSKRDVYEPKFAGEEKFESWPTGGSYDNVEVRKEAWKTLGLDQINHNEYTPDKISTTTSNAITFISRSQDNLNSEPARMIVLPSPIVSPDEENYDRLDYFGSTSKLDHPEYKTLVPRPSTLDLYKTKDTWNDYDEVENVMQEMRLADDSHAGYGVIRKGSSVGAMPGPQVPTATQQAPPTSPAPPIPPPHYAILSRPKRI